MKPYFDVGELADELRHSAYDVVNVLVEGPKDIVLYRHIAKMSGQNNAIIRDLGGRTGLFKLWKMRPFKDARFFADKDLFVFLEVPEEYQGINFTDGYSIENDLFVDGQSAIMALMSPDEIERFNRLCLSVCCWFAYQVHLGGKGKYNRSILTEGGIDKQNEVLSDAFLADCKLDETPQELEDVIIADFARLLGGHNLFQIFEYFFKKREEGLIREPISRNTLIQLCISKGLQSPDSNTSRIKAVMQSALGS